MRKEPFLISHDFELRYLFDMNGTVGPAIHQRERQRTYKSGPKCSVPSTKLPSIVLSVTGMREGGLLRTAPGSEVVNC